MVKKVEIGAAVLYRADCIEVMRSMEKASIDMILTDPPYGHNNNDGDLIANWEKALGRPGKVKAAPRPILNDGEEADPLFRAMLVETERLLKTPGCCCCCCCCGGGGPDPLFARWSLWMDEVFKFKQAVVWDKGPIGMGWHYRRSYEFVLVAEKRGSGKAKWYDTTKKIENILRGGRGEPGRIGKIIPRSSQHPTEKPVRLGEFFIGLHSQRGDLVLDPFMGSGAFGEAALKMGRRFIGIELDPAHFEVACRRIAQAQGLPWPVQHEVRDAYELTEQQAARLEGGA